MKKVLGVLVGLIAVAVIGVVGVFALSNGGTSPLNAAADSAKATVVNAAADATGLKAQAQEALETHSAQIATALGISQDEAEAAIASIDLTSWQTTTLPSGATATGTLDGSSFGMDGTVTTYDDPGYVTVDAYGQTVTFAVPESAQASVAALLP